MDAGMRRQVTVGNDSSLVIAGDQIDRDTLISDPFKRFKCHGDQLRRDLATVQKITAMYDAIYPAVQSGLKRTLKIGEKFRPPATPLYSRTKWKIKTQVSIGQKQCAN